MDDYPNHSESFYPEAPKERVEAEEKERTRVTSSIAVVQDVIDWLVSTAELYARIDSLEIDEKTEPTAALIAMNTAKRMRSAFLIKAGEFKTEFAEHLDKQE